MGLFTKSLIILLVAISTPLVYRQFATDNTIKFMSSYYSNYKSIDNFLRQSANHIDQAKDQLTNSAQIKGIVDKVNQHLSNLVAQAPTTTTTTPGKTQKDEPKPKVEASIRLVKCPNEDLEGKEIRLWSKQELAKYDGNSGEQDVYLAFMGIVYNVTVNSQHYAAGAEYNVFAGRDATRAFVTGNFSHDLHDDIRDIDESLYSHIESWASFYNTGYPALGRIEGKFFDSKGCATQELARVYQVFDKLEQDKLNRREEEKDLPDCNSEWNSDLNKGRVWCSKKSGGIERDWVGVPRIYNSGESQRCACFNLDGPDAAETEKYLSMYPDCDPKASECPLKQ